MKKYKYLLLFTLICLLTNTGYTQKKFTEGTIIYTIKLDSEKATKMASMLPTEMVMKIKGEKSRTEMSTGLMETIALSNNKDNSGAILMDIMGNKYAMKMDEKLLAAQQEKMPDYSISETSQTKIISGYNCKLVKMVDNKTGDSVLVYYSDAIPYFANTMTLALKSIKGMPLEFTTSLQGVKMQVIVKSITAGKMEDSLFEIPAGYKVVTQEELMKDLSGN